MNLPTLASARGSKRATFAATVVLPMVLIVAGVFAAVAVVLHLAAQDSDRDALARETALVSGTLERSVAEIVWQQESATVWDQTIENLRTLDPDWLDDNAGVWLHEYFGIDEVYILDSADKPVYSMTNGHRSTSEAYAGHGPTLARLATKLRVLSAQDGGTSLHEIVSLAGRPAIVGASLVISDTGRIEQPAGSEFLHIAVRYMDGSYLASLAEKTAVDSPHVRATAPPDVHAGHTAVTASTGETLGYIVWTADRPGSRLLRRAFPVLAVAVFLVYAMVWLMARRLYRTTSALRTSEEEARHLALHDPLTGLANRASFNQALEAAIDRVFAGERVALIYVDLDRFKYVNDTFGHHAGDELIRQLARRLKAMVRSEDSVARLGGDEFAVIQSDVRDDSEVASLCERILTRVAEPFQIGGNATYVGASIGVVISPDEGVDGNDLTRKADIALYGAKSSGRNNYRVFVPEMDRALQRRQTLEQDMRKALAEDGEITTAFQPIVGVDGKTLLGMEALVRWTHPEFGAIPPSEFVPIAEEIGRIGEIGDVVLANALRMSAVCDLKVAVNVSPVQLLTSSFPARLIRMIGEAGLTPADVELEITETVLLDGQDRTRQVLEGLRREGFSIALDDFGTGYSSLAYLRTFPVDRIKIDRSFVHTLSTDADAAKIVQAVADLGRALGKHVTAEGVETEEQFLALVEAGCDAFQGHLISPPLSSDALLAFVGVETESRDGQRPRGVA